MNDLYRSPCRGGWGMHKRGAPSINGAPLFQLPGNNVTR